MRPLTLSRSSRWSPPRTGPFVVPLLAALATGCATPGPQLAELTAWEPPRGQTCRTFPPDGILRARLDTTAVAEAVRSGAPRDGTLLLSVSVDSTGLDRFRRIETDLPEPDAAALERAVREALAPSEPSPSRGSGRILLRTAGGAVGELTVGAYQTCRPVVANRADTERRLRDLARAGHLPGTASVKMRVDTTGAVVETELANPSQWLERDLDLVRVARQIQFHPAVLDRHRVAVWVVLDLTIRAARPREPPPPR